VPTFLIGRVINNYVFLGDVTVLETFLVNQLALTVDHLFPLFLVLVYQVLHLEFHSGGKRILIPEGEDLVKYVLEELKVDLTLSEELLRSLFGGLRHQLILTVGTADNMRTDLVQHLAKDLNALVVDFL
jgi:hypothetical protein